MTTRREAKGGYILVDELETGKRSISAYKNDADPSTPLHTWVTAYPLPLIEQILDLKGVDFVCDEIEREETQEEARDRQNKQMLEKIEANLSGLITEIEKMKKDLK